MENFDLEKLTEVLVLREEEESLVDIPVEDWNTCAVDSRVTLVGRLLTDKPYNMTAFKQTVTRIINPGLGMEIQSISNGRMLFIFKHVRDKIRALEGCPWSFDKSVLLLASFSNDQDPATVNLNLCEFYVQITGLPITRMTREVATHIGNKIGIFREVDLDERKRSTFDFLRIKVSIDVTKPLRRVVRVMGGGQSPVLLRIQYERLPNYCYYCGFLGHVMKECKLQYSDDFNPDAPLQFGSWLRVATPDTRFKNQQQVWNSAGAVNERRNEPPSTLRHGMNSGTARGAAIFGSFMNSTGQQVESFDRGRTLETPIEVNMGIPDTRDLVMQSGGLVEHDSGQMESYNKKHSMANKMGHDSGQVESFNKKNSMAGIMGCDGGPHENGLMGFPQEKVNGPIKITPVELIERRPLQEVASLHLQHNIPFCFSSNQITLELPTKKKYFWAIN